MVKMYFFSKGNMCWGRGGRRGRTSTNRFGRGRVQGCPALHSAGCCRRRGSWRALGSVEQLQELTLKPAEPLVSALLLPENHSPTFPMEQALGAGVNWGTEQQLHTLLSPAWRLRVWECWAGGSPDTLQPATAQWSVCWRSVCCCGLQGQWEALCSSLLTSV